MTEVPRELSQLPRAVLQQLRTACAGDWRRVEVHGPLDFTVHNHPQFKRTQLPDVRPPVRRGRPAAKKKATAAAPAPAPVAEPTAEPVTEPAPAPGAAPAPLPPALAAPAPQTATETVRERLWRSEREREQAERVQPQRYDKPLPAGFDISVPWEQLDASRVASSILTACLKGLPEALPLDLHPDVLALQGLQKDLVVTSVRHPDHVEIAGSDTVEKGYPVLRFYRADVMTVVGLRELRAPIVIATYSVSHLQHDQHRVNHTSGGGQRRTQGLPKTPALVAKRLRQMGAEVAVDELSGQPATVTYRGQELGKITVADASAEQCQSDYQRMVRKVQAICSRS